VIKNGIILIDKPLGLTSFGVVARIRRVLSQQHGKKVKVGHTGTLDPFATGLMILTIGQECRNAEKYSKLDKIYTATLQLGQTSTTGDPEGEITKFSDKKPTRAEAKSALSRFKGKITQKPPAFSAIRINGQRAYKLARSGQKVELPDRQVTIYDLELVGYQYPKLKIRAHVSSGTYIRSLAADIGKTLSCGAYCKELRRLAIADYKVSQAKTLIDFGITN
jgi:tRNA pseudouridine55 synthase